MKFSCFVSQLCIFAPFLFLPREMRGFRVFFSAVVLKIPTQAVRAENDEQYYRYNRTTTLSDRERETEREKHAEDKQR